VKILPVIVFRGLVPVFKKPTVNQKFFRKPPVILKIVPKADHECTVHRINLTNEIEGQPEQKYDADYVL
jgi:hypothetical protein